MILTDLCLAICTRNPDFARTCVEHHFEVLNFIWIIRQANTHSDVSKICG